MSKEDVVSAAVSSIQSAQAQALSDGLGSVYDAGLAAAPVATGGLSQADVDAAVAAAQAADAQALADAQAAAAAALAAVQSQLDQMTAKEQLEEAAVSGLQSSVVAVQAALDAIKALIVPSAPPAQS